MQFNHIHIHIHFSLICHFIFSSVSSWTRLGSSQSEDIISDYNSCGRQLLSQIQARKWRPPTWVPAEAFVSCQCWHKDGWMEALFLNGPHLLHLQNVNQRNPKRLKTNTKKLKMMTNRHTTTKRCKVNTNRLKTTRKKLFRTGLSWSEGGGEDGWMDSYKQEWL